MTVAIICHATSVFAELDLLGATYRADTPFPQFMPFWREAWGLKNLKGETLQYAYEGMPVGGSVHIFVRNTGKQPLEIGDVLLEGVSLRRAITFAKGTRKRRLYPASIHFANLPSAKYNRLILVGEPIWWRVDPQPIPPSGAAEIIVRLRRTPQKETLRVGLKHADGVTKVSVPIRKVSPQVAGISFSLTLDKVYLYLHYSGNTRQKPSRILMDGQDITDESSIGYDATLDITPVVAQLNAPLLPGSFHCFQAVYENGINVLAGLRAWNYEFAYGIWGAKRGKASELELARWYMKDIYNHNINVQMEMIGSDAVREFLKSKDGQQLCANLGIRRMVSDVGKGNTKKPFAYFLLDEPDCGDYRVNSLKPHQRVGSLAQSLIQRSRGLRAQDPATPQLLNVDMTFKPDNWYIYGQLPDIFAADPYYQERLRSAYWDHPDRLPLYTKATYVYAVGTVCQSACAPKPLHLILNSVCHTEKERRFRYATPDEKRAEVYYALAAGAKSLSYWWYTPLGRYVGCGADDPQAIALWQEIGLLGAEARTAGPVIVKSCPIVLSITASRRLWVRCLIAGLDHLVLLCVNDDYASDRIGTVVQPLERAEATIKLPSWLEPKDAFEITYEGTRDISWECRGSQLDLHLGKLRLTRLILISTDIRLRGRLQKLYEEQFAANVARLVANKHN